MPCLFLRFQDHAELVESKGSSATRSPDSDTTFIIEPDVTLWGVKKATVAPPINFTGLGAVMYFVPRVASIACPDWENEALGMETKRVAVSDGTLKGLKVIDVEEYAEPL